VLTVWCAVDVRRTFPRWWGRIERWLRDEIAPDARQPGDRLPSMNALHDQFGARSLAGLAQAVEAVTTAQVLRSIHTNAYARPTEG
jgi:DNA-binding GntR family transcriptional regulator